MTKSKYPVPTLGDVYAWLGGMVQYPLEAQIVINYQGEFNRLRVCVQIVYYYNPTHFFVYQQWSELLPMTAYSEVGGGMLRCAISANSYLEDKGADELVKDARYQAMMTQPRGGSRPWG